MSAKHEEKSGSEPKKEGIERQRKTPWWPFAVGGFILFLILISVPNFGPMFGGDKTSASNKPAHATSAPIKQVVCPSFSREHRYCTFNKNGTTSIGQEDGGTKLRFCFDLPYQSPENQHASYQLLYKDLRTGGFRDIRLAEPGSVVTEMMFVGLDGDRPVTVGYNLAEQCNTGAATEDESSDEEEESEPEDEEEEE